MGRAPLPGWTTDYQRFMGMQAGKMYLTVDLEDGNPHVPNPTKARYWVEGSFERSRAAKDLEAAQLAAEDAARAMVADMAKALGGSVTWGVPCPGCGTTESDVVVDGETQCGRCGMIGPDIQEGETCRWVYDHEDDFYVTDCEQGFCLETGDGRRAHPLATGHPGGGPVRLGRAAAGAG